MRNFLNSCRASRVFRDRSFRGRLGYFGSLLMFSWNIARANINQISTKYPFCLSYVNETVRNFQKLGGLQQVFSVLEMCEGDEDRPTLHHTGPSAESTDRLDRTQHSLRMSNYRLRYCSSINYHLRGVEERMIESPQCRRISIFSSSS